MARSRSRAFEEIKEFDTHFSRSKKGGMVRSFHPKDFIPAGKIRRLDRASQFAIAASKLALADAQFSVTRENSSKGGSRPRLWFLWPLKFRGIPPGPGSERIS